MSADAWKDSGKCEECRKKAYCKNPCSAQKRVFKNTVYQMAFKAFAGVYAKRKEGKDDADA